MFVTTVDIGAEGLEVDRVLEPAALRAREGGRGLELSRVHLVGILCRLGLGFGFRGHLKTAVKLACSRCLEPYRQDCYFPFDLIYTEPVEDRARESAGGEQEPEDPAVSLLDPSGRIDLAALALEQIYLWTPLKPLCRPDCGGLCKECGARKDMEPCNCRTTSTDPRWAALEALKNKR